MVEHYQKDADGLVTRLKVPVEKKSGKVEYSVDSEDFKKSTSSGGGGQVSGDIWISGDVGGQLPVWGTSSVR